MIRGALHDNVWVLALSRPERRNALTPPMLDELTRLVEHPAPGARAVLLLGDGAAFCAGFDLELCRDDGSLRALLAGLSRAVLAMRGSALPVVLCAHGAAVAGGCALLGGADVVVTHDDAKLGYPVLRIGISPAVSAPFLSASTTPGRARRLLLHTPPISGREALRIGLAHDCASTVEGAIASARKIASELAGKSPPAIALTKRWMSELDASLDAAAADRGLGVSLDLVGSDEQHGLMEAARHHQPAPPPENL